MTPNANQLALTSGTKITLAVIILAFVLITFVTLYFTDQHIKAAESRIVSHPVVYEAA